TVSSRPAISWNGESHLVVWAQQAATGYDIRAVRVSGAGIVLDPDSITISTAQGYQVSPLEAYRIGPAVTWDGSAHLVVWSDVAHVFGARVSRQGVVLDPDGIRISTAPGSQDAPAASWDGTNHLVVWEDFRNNNGGSDIADVYGARVSAAGVVLDPDGVAISTSPATQQRPAVSWDGT